MLILFIALLSSLTSWSASVDPRPSLTPAPQRCSSPRGTLILRNVIPTLYNTADPHVLRVETECGPDYYLTSTAGTEDIRIQKSADLYRWSNVKYAFGGEQRLRASGPGHPIKIGSFYYCHIWAPEIFLTKDQRYLLTFTAVRIERDIPCPAPNSESSIFATYADKPSGPYLQTAGWPKPIRGPGSGSCALSQQLPISPSLPASGCLGRNCDLTPRLDSSYFTDPLTSKTWLAYSWYRWNAGSLTDQVSSLVPADSAEPHRISCAEEATTPYRLADGSDPRLTQQLTQSSGGFRLSFNQGRLGPMAMSVAEAPSLFRKGEYVYSLMSANGWDSDAYQVFWVAARWPSGLRDDNSQRFVGRFLVPEQGAAGSGHGAPVLGPDNKTWLYIHHRQSNPQGCIEYGVCSRELMVTPIEFEDRNDSRGKVWIKTRIIRQFDSYRDLWIYPDYFPSL